MKNKGLLLSIIIVTYLGGEGTAAAQEITDISANINYNEFNNYDDEYSEYDDEDYVENNNDVQGFIIYDPLEPINRGIFIFNDKVDVYFLGPVARGYRRVLPKRVRKSVRNFLANLATPVVLANSLLQGDVENSGRTFARFVINTTVGLGGLFDVATHRGVIGREEDFGQTLGRYKIGAGPYIVLPLLGPSSLRDSFGLVVDYAVDPLGFNALEIGGERELVNNNVKLARTGVDTVDTREKHDELIEDVRKTSFDPYSTMRSIYLQNRKYKINNAQ